MSVTIEIERKVRGDWCTLVVEAEYDYYRGLDYQVIKAINQETGEHVIVGKDWADLTLDDFCLLERKLLEDRWWAA